VALRRLDNSLLQNAVLSLRAGCSRALQYALCEQYWQENNIIIVSTRSWEAEQQSTGDQSKTSAIASQHFYTVMVAPSGRRLPALQQLLLSQVNKQVSTPGTCSLISHDG
jgi:hypothetical protein